MYPEEQKVEVGGKLYRRCAAALVFNLKGEVLVGERTDRPGSWNMPQGGVEVCACLLSRVRCPHFPNPIRFFLFWQKECLA